MKKVLNILGYLAAVLLVASPFLPWYQKAMFGIDVGITGMGTVPYGFIVLAAGLATGVLLVLKKARWAKYITFAGLASLIVAVIIFLHFNSVKADLKEFDAELGDQVKLAIGFYLLLGGTLLSVLTGLRHWGRGKAA